MKNLIVVLALFSSIVLNAQAGQKTVNGNNAKTTQKHGVSHPNNTQKDNGAPPPVEARKIHNRIEDISVEYCMKDGPCKSRHFRTRTDAQAFIETLSRNPDCISHHIDNIR